MALRSLGTASCGRQGIRLGMDLNSVTSDLSGRPAIVAGLGEIADRYEVLLCDVWGVLHDGRRARTGAVEALRHFRRRRGPVILLSNAPRPVEDVMEQFVRFGVPQDCYDRILTSGVLVREELARRAAGRELKLLHLGPARDRGIFAGLSIACVESDEAELVVCTGLIDDDRETPDDYRERLSDLHRRGLTLLCANPDIVVQRGSRLVYCAGALARLYQELGGVSVYYGKPHAPIYTAALAFARALAGQDESAGTRNRRRTANRYPRRERRRDRCAVHRRRHSRRRNPRDEHGSSCRPVRAGRCLRASRHACACMVRGRRIRRA